MVAHENPDLLGLPASEVNGPDQYPAGLMVVAAATADGAWVDYSSTTRPPARPRFKHSWVVQHDGLTFGSGWYEAGHPGNMRPEPSPSPTSNGRSSCTESSAAMRRSSTTTPAKHRRPVVPLYPQRGRHPRRERRSRDRPGWLAAVCTAPVST